MVYKLYAPLVQWIMVCLVLLKLLKSKKMQNRASCIFSNNFKRNVPNSVILNKLYWMTVLNRCDYLLSVLMYKLLNNCIDINNCRNIDFHLASDMHNYPSRYSQAKSLSVPSLNKIITKEA